MALGSAGSGLLALPMLSDGMNFDWPQYYETIQTASRLTCHTVQSADLDGDGQDELICRGPAGINAYSYDPVTGQWISLPPGPAWSDAAGWAAECYYATIQAADLNGDGRAELFGHGPNGTEVWSYDPTTGVWSEVPCGSDPLADGSWDGAETYTTLQCADLDGDGSAELLARGTTGIVAWKLTATGFVALPDGPGWSDAASWNLPQYYTTIQCADLDGDGADELFARNNTQIAAWKLVDQAWQQLTYGPMFSDADGWNLPQYYSTIRTASVLAGATTSGHASSTVAVLIARSAYSMLTYRYATSGWVATTAPWPNLNDDAYQAVAELLALSAGLQVRNIYNDSSALTHAASTLITKPIPAPPPSYTGSPTVWNETVTQLAAEVGWAIAVNGWYGNVSGLTTATYLDQNMGLSTVCGTLQLDQDSTSAELSLLSIAFNIAWAVLGVAAPLASAVAGVLATACTAAAGSWSSGPLQGDVVQLQAELTNAFTSAQQLQQGQQLAITGGYSTAPVVGDYGMLAAIGGQLQSGSPAWNWDGGEGAMELAAVQSYAVSCWQALVLPAQWRWSVNPTAITWQNDPSYADYVTNKWFWDLSGTGEVCATYFTSHYDGPMRAPSMVLPATMQLLFGPDSADIGGPVYPLLVSLGDVLTAQNGWPQLTGDWTSPDDSNCEHVQPPYGPEVAAGSPPGGAPMPPHANVADRGNHLAIVPVDTSVRGEVYEPVPADDLNDLQVRARMLRVAGDQVLVRVTVSNHGLVAAEAVQIVEASLAGRSALGGLPSRPTHIGAGRRVSRQLWFGAPSKTEGTSGLRVRLVLRDGEHVEMVALSQP